MHAYLVNLQLRLAQRHNILPYQMSMRNVRLTQSVLETARGPPDDLNCEEQTIAPAALIERLVQLHDRVSNGRTFILFFKNNKNNALSGTP